MFGPCPILFSRILGCTSVENEPILPLHVLPDGPVAAGDVGRLLVISEVTWQQVGHRTRAAHSQAVRISRLSFCKVQIVKNKTKWSSDAAAKIQQICLTLFMYLCLYMYMLCNVMLIPVIGSCTCRTLE